MILIVMVDPVVVAVGDDDDDVGFVVVLEVLRKLV